jgi:hypothetical protein
MYTITRIGNVLSICHVATLTCILEAYAREYAQIKCTTLPEMELHLLLFLMNVTGMLFDGGTNGAEPNGHEFALIMRLSNQGS